jgi:uncharacterized protein YlxW (UPF0749 family)
MKGWKPWFAAFVITGVLACGMLMIGLAAVANPSGVPVSNRNDVVMTSAATAGNLQSQVSQLEDVVRQYQAREQQYQAELAQEQQMVSGYQQVLLALQDRGLITITGDGRILVRGGG